MKLWLNLKDLFSFQPPSQQDAPQLLTEVYKEFMFEGTTTLNKAQIENIRFDNSMRIAISLLAIVTSFVLWAGNVIPQFGPVFTVFIAYAALQILGGWILTKSSHYREINYSICTVDILALSLGVYWTGSTTSPLYFIYFMPLIIQAFHRDWALLVYYGLGGLISYSAAIMFSIPHWNSQSLIALGTRISFMAFTVGLALLAVNLLRKNEAQEKRRTSRLKCLVYVSQVMNAVGALKDLPAAIQEFVKIMNLELHDPAQAWTRIFVTQNGEPLMQVIQDLSQQHPELKQAIPHNACPAMQKNDLFQVKDREKETGCPVESFSMFRSHICVPITGQVGESFGVIFSGGPKANAFREEDIQFLQFIGKSVGLTIQRLKRVEELKMVFEMDSCAMATFLGSTRTMEDTTGAIMDGIRTILNADQVQLMLWNPEKAQLVTKSVSGNSDALLQNRSFNMGEGIPGRVLESGKPYWTYNLQSNSFYEPASPFRGLLAIPLQTMRGEPLGVVIAAIINGQRTFSIEEIDLASTFCTRASVAVENANLHLKERGSAVRHAEKLDFPNEKAA